MTRPELPQPFPVLEIIPWCCRHKRTITYISVIVTLILLLQIAELLWSWP